MKNFTTLLILSLVVLFSCNSDDEPDVAIETYDGDYFGISTLLANNIVGVWNIKVTNGEIVGTATYIEENRTLLVPLNGTIKASGAFDIEISYGGNLTGSIAGLIEISGSVSGKWESDGVSGDISGNKLEFQDKKFDGDYFGTAENSDYVWSFEIGNGIIEGEFGGEKFASFIGLQGTTLKLIELSFVLDGKALRVVFEIHEDGTVAGSWENQNDSTSNGNITGSDSQ